MSSKSTMTENETELMLPGFTGELPESIGPFDQCDYSRSSHHDKEKITIKYTVGDAVLALLSHFREDNCCEDDDALQEELFEIVLDENRGEQQCPRRHTESYEDILEAVQALQRVAESYEAGTVYEKDDYHYYSAVTVLVEKYRPEYSEYFTCRGWPDDFEDVNLAIYNRDEDTVIAKLDILHRDEWSKGCLISPPDYTIPTERPPLSDIEDDKKLPAAGQQIYYILKLAGSIGVRPDPNKRDIDHLRNLIEELHVEYDYHPDLMWGGLLEEAQRRGDLTESEDHEDSSEDAVRDSEIGSQPSHDCQDQSDKPVEDWF